MRRRVVQQWFLYIRTTGTSSGFCTFPEIHACTVVFASNNSLPLGYCLSTQAQDLTSWGRLETAQEKVYVWDPHPFPPGTGWVGFLPLLVVRYRTSNACLLGPGNAIYWTGHNFPPFVCFPTWKLSLTGGCNLCPVISMHIYIVFGTETI